ncbi:MAG: ABC transporter permease [Candidatus Tectomicrobia bacterium]|uniref:ABC transporter permease n=1 Tax=Tectimicrobiota bacterium TaxID=2528274 RepID=A0A933GMH0_UNCTE|nr:ABC transporter permease [Candidatus Tectomicrobia bacterium]
MNLWDEILNKVFFISLLSAAIRLGTPLLLAALGEIFVEKSGMINVGIEGEMLTGALFGFMGAYYFQNLGIGLLISVISGCFMGLILAFFFVTLRSDQIVTGIALNIFSLGLTSFIHRLSFGTGLIPPMVNQMSNLGIPFLKDLSLVGAVLFNQNIVVYIGLMLVGLLWFVNCKTTLGLALKASGEFPLAAETMGVKVLRLRYGTVIFGGAMAGLAGGYLSLAQLSMFTENMTAGRGFIALALVIFGRWEPVKVLWGALIFGGADALQMRLQGLGVKVPYQFMLMMPYLLCILVLLWMRGKTKAPSYLGVPYNRD